MSQHDELERKVANLGGQMTGVQAAFDAMMLCVVQQGGGASLSSLRGALSATLEVFPMNPNLTGDELAGATAFLSSAIETLDELKKHIS